MAEERAKGTPAALTGSGISTTSLIVELYSGHHVLTTNHLGSDLVVCWLCVDKQSSPNPMVTLGGLGHVWASGAIKDNKCFGLRKQSNRMPFSKWIVECDCDKELSASQTFYSRSSVPWNFRQIIALLHPNSCTRLEFLEKLEF
ncbi:hypothetical protein EK904_013670 [Melospiza melodia maxima]|nr:hypothetical protein EK904_013670 [Melospiza melodia maxima]